VDTQAAMDLARLRAVLLKQDGRIALAGGAALLQAFDELLAQIIGPSLVQRLLNPVRPDPADAISKEEGSP
jgi:hypothetical protein